jgi:NAD-dependent deacetylase
MTAEPLDKKIDDVADMIVRVENTVVFTGAGISTESGIPDFRSPGGIWSRFDPDDFTIQKFLTSPETRRKQWHLLLESGLFFDAKPNKAHYAIAELEKIGRLNCVITQNIDDLHQKAGNQANNVYELHGNMKRLKCLDCDERYPMEDIVQRFTSEMDVPLCEKCQGILKPDVTFFGEALPEDALNMAMYHSSHCDLFIVVGSSLVVYPAAYMPLYAKEAGAKIVIINMAPTSYDSSADIIINEMAGEIMEKIVEEVKNRISMR